MGVIRAEEMAERARAWGEGDPRVSALLVYGSVAQGRADEWSDLDVVIVSVAGARAALWSERAALADRILGGPHAWAQEPSWQRDHRFQAWRVDLAQVDLTFDEGAIALSEAIAGEFVALIDRHGVVDRVRAEARNWQPPEHDAGAFDGATWVWLAHLAGRLRKGQLAMVRSGVARILHERVIPLFGAGEHAVEARLDERDQERLQASWPISSEPAELARALRETAALYDDGLDAWSRRTGRARPLNPLAAAVRERIGRRAGGRVSGSPRQPGLRRRR